MILVDSSVWIDYFRGNTTRQTESLDSLLGAEPLAVGDLILVEVLQGFHNERDFRQAKKLLTSLTVVDLGGQHMAIRAAQNFRRLRLQGVTEGEQPTVFRLEILQDGGKPCPERVGRNSGLGGRLPGDEIEQNGGDLQSMGIDTIHDGLSRREMAVYGLFSGLSTAKSAPKGSFRGPFSHKPGR